MGSLFVFFFWPQKLHKFWGGNLKTRVRGFFPSWGFYWGFLVGAGGLGPKNKWDFYWIFGCFKGFKFIWGLLGIGLLQVLGGLGGAGDGGGGAYPTRGGGQGKKFGSFKLKRMRGWWLLQGAKSPRGGNTGKSKNRGLGFFFFFFPALIPPL